jgi:nitroreductase
LKTHVGISTFTYWRTTRVERIRYLEYSLYFNLLTQPEKDRLLNDDSLSLVQLIASFSHDNKKLTQTIVESISGESVRTLRSWWHAQSDKRVICLELILGVVSMLLVANQPKYSAFWATTAEEIAYKEYANPRFNAAIDIKAFERWKVSQS